MFFSADELWSQPFAANHFFRKEETYLATQGHRFAFLMSESLRETLLCRDVPGASRRRPNKTLPMAMTTSLQMKQHTDES
jgi:hypothetical protein